uniref:Uncharacterized protein n=1 Tax=Anguilla anguilla TaxID=7936 RepID=A0A0E9PR91_ANGAN
MKMTAVWVLWWLLSALLFYVTR